MMIWHTQNSTLAHHQREKMSRKSNKTNKLPLNRMSDVNMNIKNTCKLWIFLDSNRNRTEENKNKQKFIVNGHSNIQIACYF